MWLKQNNKLPIWEWFIPSIYVDLGDGLCLCWVESPATVAPWLNQAL